MANTLRIKRRAAGGAAGAPASLANAELAFNEQDNTLYYGTGTGGAGGTATSVIAIGGSGAFVATTGTQTIAGAKTFSSIISGSIDGNAGTATALATARKRAFGKGDQGHSPIARRTTLFADLRQPRSGTSSNTIFCLPALPGINPPLATLGPQSKPQIERPAMKYFRLLEAQIDPAPFLAEIAAHENAFEENRGRQEKIAVQREALAIPLRGLKASAIGNRKRRDVHESRWTTTSQKYPVARAFLEDLAAKLDSELSRAKIVCLPPGHKVYPHIDRGEYYRLRNRYHLVLASSGSWMRAGDEEVRMKTGELWWFDNDQEHEACNDGNSDRIHMIFDLLPRERLNEIGADAAAMAAS